MKKALQLLCIPFFYINSNAQIDFQKNVVVNEAETTRGPVSVNTVDIDGDGDMDVISSLNLDGVIAWYENLDGKGVFGLQQSVATNVKGVNSAFPIDIDGDGDMDVLAAIDSRSSSDGRDRITWYENLDGLGSFGAEQTITTEVRGGKSVYGADIDGDGDIDAVSISHSDGKIAWYENTNGLGTFGNQQIIDTEIGAKALYVSDIDGDNDMDILFTKDSNFGHVSWLENLDSNGSFGPIQTIASYNSDGFTSVHTEDIDTDGDLDVLYTYANNVAWSENTDGQGDFGPIQIITSIETQASAVFAADFDLDGDIDVLAASEWNDTISWYENMDGKGAFGLQQIISNNAITPFSAYASDIDNDGDIDVLSTSVSDNKIAWYKNKNGLGDFGLPLIISKNSDFPISIVSADLDGDGTKDILCSSRYDKEISWYPNIEGKGDFKVQYIISNEIGNPGSVHSRDIDGDGDMDVIAFATSGVERIVWFENLDGQGSFGTEQIIADYVSDLNNIFPVDIDGDGDLDILSSDFDDKLMWYENIDSKGNFSVENIISSNQYNIASIHANDIDNDGDMDVFISRGTSSNGNSLHWYENIDGLGTFSSSPRINEIGDVDEPKSIATGDVDGDGDSDLIVTSKDDRKLSWYENTDGQGTFGTQQIISSTSTFISHLNITDLDSDGDMDIVTHKSFVLGWYENVDGAGNFSDFNDISTVQGNRIFYSTDIDSDGDIDVISTGVSDEINWYENSPDVVLSTSENEQLSVSVFPVPSKDLLFINNFNNYNIKQIVVYDINGRLIIKQKQNFEYVNISGLSNGIYLLNLLTDTGKFTKKIIKE